MNSNLPTQCPQCGNAFKEDSIFCRKCGLKRGEQVTAAWIPVSLPNLQQSPQMVQSQGQVPATALGLPGQQSPLSLGQAVAPARLITGQAAATTLAPNHNAMPTMQAASPCMAALSTSSQHLQQLPQTLPTAPTQWSGQQPAHSGSFGVVPQVPASLPSLQQAPQVAQVAQASPVQGQSPATFQQFPGQCLQAASPWVASQIPASVPAQMTQPSVMQAQSDPQVLASVPAIHQLQAQPVKMQGYSPAAVLQNPEGSLSGSLQVSHDPRMMQSFQQPVIQSGDSCGTTQMPMLPLQSRGGQLPHADFVALGRNESALTTEAPGPSPIPMLEAGQPCGFDQMSYTGGPCHMKQTVPLGIQETFPPSLVASPLVHKQDSEFLQEQLVQPSPINFSALQPASDQDHEIGFYEGVGAPQEFSEAPGSYLASYIDKHQVSEPGEKLGLLASYRLEGNPVHPATSPKVLAKAEGSKPLSSMKVQGEMVCPACSAELIEFHRQDRLAAQLDAHKVASDRIFRENRQLLLEVEELHAKLQEIEGRAPPGSDLESKMQRLEELERYVLELQKSNVSYQAQMQLLQDQTGQPGLVEKLGFAREAENIVSENTALKAKNLELEARLTQQKVDYDADVFVLQATVRELEVHLPQEDSGLAAENTTLQAIVKDLQNRLAQSAAATMENSVLKQKLAGLDGRLARMSDGADTTSFQNQQLQNEVAELETELERLRAISAFAAEAAASPTALQTQPSPFSQDRPLSQAQASTGAQLNLPQEDPTLQARVSELASRPLYEADNHGTVSFSDSWGLLNSYNDRPDDDEADRDTLHFYDQRDQHGIPSLPVIFS